MNDEDDLPRDPDLDDVPVELQQLAEADGVTVLSEDGVSTGDTLVIVPGLFGHARRLDEG
jgi:hypothetical protein